MKVHVYVEGRSDMEALSVLLESLIERKKSAGISIDFFESPKGNKKKSLLTQIPVKAIHILSNQPNSIVVVLPDLYPKNIPFPHVSYNELKDSTYGKFIEELNKKNITDNERLLERFKVFCFKYDLEALILASEEQLISYLGLNGLVRTWTVPVEDQNHGNPPKRIVETLFQSYGQKYKDTVDAPLILRHGNYLEIAAKCPQCFKPLVDFLESLKEPS